MVEFDVTTIFGGIENTTTYQVNSTKPTRVTFQPNDVYVTNSEQRDKAIWVQTRNESMISLFVISGGFHSTDGLVGLPCDAMKVPSDYNSYQYLILSTRIVTSDEAMTSKFLVITCEDATTVSITPSTTINGHTFEHSVFGPETSSTSSRWRMGGSTSISVGQTLLVTANGDFTGTLVTGNRPLVVIAGHQCGQVPESVTTCDHMAVQIPPHTTFGYIFLLSPLSGRQSGDLYRFATIADDTLITITCVEAGGVARMEYCMVLNTDQGPNWGQFETHSEACGVEHTPKYCCLESTEPVIVAQYSYGNQRDESCNGDIGGPFISVIPPIAQYLNSYNLVPVSVTSGHVLRRYLTVSVPATYFQPSQILMDDYPFETNATLWQLIHCTGGEICGYSLTKPLDNNAHIVYHVNRSSAILVDSYRYLVGNSYAFVGGMGLRPISGKLLSKAND